MALLLDLLFGSDTQSRYERRDRALSEQYTPSKRSYIVLSNSDIIEFDCLEDAQHEFPSQITQYPVERNSNVADHVINQNNTFSVSGIFSNANIGINNSANWKKEEDVYFLLLEQRSNRNLVALTTPLGSFPNLLIKSITIPKNAEVGRSLRLNMTFEQVRLVDSSTTTVSVTVDSKKTTGKTKDKVGVIKDGGDKSGKEATTTSKDSATKQRAQSVLDAAAEGLANLKLGG